jgi:hypothetical protein
MESEGRLWSLFCNRSGLPSNFENSSLYLSFEDTRAILQKLLMVMSLPEEINDYLLQTLSQSLSEWISDGRLLWNRMVVPSEGVSGVLHRSCSDGTYLSRNIATLGPFGQSMRAAVRFLLFFRRMAADRPKNEDCPRSERFPKGFWKAGRLISVYCSNCWIFHGLFIGSLNFVL